MIFQCEYQAKYSVNPKALFAQNTFYRHISLAVMREASGNKTNILVMTSVFLFFFFCMLWPLSSGVRKWKK